jgi:hypothetical protein
MLPIPVFAGLPVFSGGLVVPPWSLKGAAITFEPGIAHDRKPGVSRGFYVSRGGRGHERQQPRSCKSVATAEVIQS